MSTFFEDALLRLKGELKLQNDKDVAQWLGMSPTAFNARKGRDAFPREKLLAAPGADKIDTAYVLTGTRGAAHAALANVKTSTEMATRLGLDAVGAAALAQSMQLPADEQVLLNSYRQCGPEARAQLIQQAALLAAGLNLHPIANQPAQTPTARQSVVQHNTGQGAVQIGTMGAPPPKKRRS